LKKKDKYLTLDDIGFIGTQENLSATAKKAIDKRISEFLKTYRDNAPKKEKSKKAKPE
jgi:hypothetical protein